MRSAAWHCSERDSKTRAARGSQRHSQPPPRGLREAPEAHGQPALPRRCRSPRAASPASSTPTPAPRPLWDVRRRGRRLKQGFRRGHRTPDRDKPHPDRVPCPETVTDGDGLEPPFRRVSAFKAFCPTRVSDRAGQRDHSAHAPHGQGRGRGGRRGEGRRLEGPVPSAAQSARLGRTPRTCGPRAATAPSTAPRRAPARAPGSGGWRNRTPSSAVLALLETEAPAATCDPGHGPRPGGRSGHRSHWKKTRLCWKLCEGLSQVTWPFWRSQGLFTGGCLCAGFCNASSDRSLQQSTDQR